MFLMNREQVINQKLHKYIQLIVVIAFYLFFAFFDGPNIGTDTAGYISMSTHREPIYPLFLWILRLIFQHTFIDYLWVAAIIQSLIAAYAAWINCTFLTKELKLNKLFSWGVLCIPAGVSLLYRQISAKNYMFSNSIITEGLAISVFLIFVRYAYEYALYNTKKPLCISVILSVVLISIRKQMMITLAILAIIAFVNNLIKSKYDKKIKKLLASIITTLIVCVTVLVGNIGIEYAYSVAFTGNASQHTGSARFIAAIAIYTSQREDVKYVDEPELKELFLDIYDTCEEKGYLLDSQLSGWHERSVHFQKNCDDIQIRTLFHKTLDYAENKYPKNSIEAHKYADEIMTDFTMSILPHHIPEVLMLYASNCISGFVYTVAKPSTILTYFSVMIYLAYIALLVWMFINRKQDSVYKNLFVFSSVILLSTVINVAVVAIGIFPQTRYMIYNMSFVYIALALMSVQLCKVLYLKFRPSN